MVKIKTKKEMTGEEYAKFMIDKFGLEKIQIENKETEIYEKFVIQAPKNLLPTLRKEDKIIIEVEEEITEDTKLDLVERFIGSMGSVCYTSHNVSIKECLKLTPRDCTTTHFYIENGDRELILIWCDGKMVD